MSVARVHVRSWQVAYRGLLPKKTDREDARHILQLMLKDDFP